MPVLLTHLSGSPSISCTVLCSSRVACPGKPACARESSCYLAAHDDGPKLAMVSNKHDLLGAHDERDEALSLSCLGALIQQHLPLHAW